MKRWAVYSKNKFNFGQRAQTILEVMFSVIIILFLMYGLVKASRFGLLDMADRRIRHDNRMLTRPSTGTRDAAVQLNPSTYRVRNPDMEYRTTAVPYTW